MQRSPLWKERNKVEKGSVQFSGTKKVSTYRGEKGKKDKKRSWSSN